MPTSFKIDKSNLTETRFYPRKAEPGTYGDVVQLPFRKNDNTGRRSNLIKDLESFDPENYDEMPPARDRLLQHMLLEKVTR